MSGDRIIAEERGDELYVYFYDTNGLPEGFQYRTKSEAADAWQVFWYEKNLQGDIVAIYTNNGDLKVTYSYDAWGNATPIYYNQSYGTFLQNNPFRYRGYYYDVDLKLYYLNSRYYDPIVGMFISPDDASYLGANGDLISYNL